MVWVTRDRGVLLRVLGLGFRLPIVGESLVHKFAENLRRAQGSWHSPRDSGLGLHV